nr:ribonuclease H-like domain-containing protein [Tanacetum cinerariifolium]
MLNNVVYSRKSDGDDNKESDSKDENVFKPEEVKKTVKPSLEKIEFVNARNTTIENENKAEKLRNCSLNKSEQVPINAAKQSSHRAAASVSAARRVNTAASRPNVNDVTIAGTIAVVSAVKGNKDNADYQEIDGGFVSFGGNAKGGKIIRKCKIRTGKLDFEDVYFVKELKFNLFSVS